MSQNLMGQKVLVIGGAKFLGEAIARKAAAAGAQVVIGARDFSLAKELAPVRVNAISPGIIDSGTWDVLGAETKQELLDGVAASTPVGRAGVNDDIADTALWLLGAGFVSGETIHVEGGARL